MQNPVQAPQVNTLQNQEQKESKQNESSTLISNPPGDNLASSIPDNDSIYEEDEVVEEKKGIQDEVSPEEYEKLLRMWEADKREYEALKQWEDDMREAHNYYMPPPLDHGTIIPGLNLRAVPDPYMKDGKDLETRRNWEWRE